MKAINEFLELAKHVVLDAANKFLTCEHVSLRRVNGNELDGREVKLEADAVLESMLMDGLLPTGLDILSEESGLVKGNDVSSLVWIVDPLDGSVNFLNRIGPSAISVALWRGNTPLFGVIYNFDNLSLAWGGKGLGAWVDGNVIHVSLGCKVDQTICCTGVPARFRIDDATICNDFFHSISRFSKVRMIGSAACSLLMVARGSTDVYIEDEIMLWDVAAGMAIIEGAGGCFWMQAGREEFSRRVVAASPTMQSELQEMNLI